MSNENTSPQTLEGVIAVALVDLWASELDDDDAAFIRDLPDTYAAAVEGAAQVAEQVRAHLAPIGALADEWDACDEHGNPLREGSLGEAADDLRAVLAATLGEGS